MVAESQWGLFSCYRAVSFRYTAEPSILQNLDLQTDVKFRLENS